MMETLNEWTNEWLVINDFFNIYNNNSSNNNINDNFVRLLNQKCFIEGVLFSFKEGWMSERISVWAGKKGVGVVI